jgi:cyclophilin family peptidyl-prolyl cis-trans isomerase
MSRRKRLALVGAGGVVAAAGLLLLLHHGSKGGGVGDASLQDASNSAPPATLADLARAEDMRQADKVSEDARTSRDPALRRRAARALARIADEASIPGLLRALGDEDAETAAWGAYGLGFSCKGHEDAFVRALGARAAVVDQGDAGVSGPVDLRFAIARAIGRCGGPVAEVLLGGWVRAKGPWRDDATYALGDVAGRRGRLDDDTVTTLLDAAGDGVIAALYPFTRAEHFNDAFASRLLEVAKKSLASAPSSERVFAVHALGKSGPDAIADLSRVATEAEFSWQERVEAVRALGKLGDPGHAAAAEVLARLLPGKDAMGMLTVSGDLYGALVTALAAIGPEPPKGSIRVLRDVSTLRPPGDPPAGLARRFAELRCRAASLLSAGAFDSSVIGACDAPGTEASERARLAALLRRPLIGPRRTAWLALTKSAHPRIREDALAAIEAHRELAETGLGVLAAALEDTKHPGVVATAADVLYAHPERAMVLSAKERRNALDPRAPAPTSTPEQEVSPAVAKALRAALAFEWSEDLVETRTKLVDAAVALRVPGAREAARKACTDPNVTVREAAAKALRALGESGPKAACPALATMPVAKELGATHGGKLVLSTDAGNLSIVFDAELAPVVSTRILDLAKAGFYDGNVIHRVVPGFVVQFGDPQGDGYGGSGKLLRCETSPVPFGPLDVGVALAGRDTGSSQLFVTLGRYPRLDGEYARIGHAEGDWYAVAEGDVITHAKVE